MSDSNMYDEYQEKTINTYNKIASKWANAHEVVNDWDEEFKYLKKHFLKPGTLIDIGCGSGRDLKSLIKLGYDCTGVDASTSMLKAAKRNAPAAKLHTLNIYNLDELNQKFDGFVCIATLLHIPRSNINQALQKIKSVLKEDSVGIITLKDGEGEEFEVRDIDGRHEERLFVYWSKKDFEAVIKNNGFGALKYSIYPIGRNRWHCFTVKNIS